MTGADINNLRKPRWYFGGVASAAASCITHPIDTIKVHMQIQKKKMPVTTTIYTTYKEEGILAFYNGLSAGLVRQLTYTTIRFAMYEAGKSYIKTDDLGGKILVASGAGLVGGFVGVPPDVVNVRMQNDVKLPANERRNYRNALHGLVSIWREEGVRRLFSGATMATGRGVLMTVGQLVSYDLIKERLLATPYFKDDVRTHFTTSLLTGVIATTLTQPLDLLKTRSMNAKPGEFKSLWDVIKFTARQGPLGFFSGYLPAFVRVGPHTVLLFLLLEQMRLRFGYLPKTTAPST